MEAETIILFCPIVVDRTGMDNKSHLDQSSGQIDHFLWPCNFEYFDKSQSKTTKQTDANDRF